MSLDELVKLMGQGGMLSKYPNGGYVPSPHPDLVELTR